MSGEAPELTPGDRVELIVAHRPGEFAVVAVLEDHVRLAPIAPDDAAIVPDNLGRGLLVVRTGGAERTVRGLVLANEEHTDVRFAPVRGSAAPAEARQRAIRVDVQVPVKIVPDSPPGAEPIFTETENLSVSGLLARIAGPVPSFASATLTIRLPRTVLRVRATTARVTSTHLALQFADVELDARVALLGFLVSL